MWGVGAGALQETRDLLVRRAGLTIKPAAEGIHHGPGFICACGIALGFEKESVSSSQLALVLQLIGCQFTHKTELHKADESESALLLVVENAVSMQ